MRHKRIAGALLAALAVSGGGVLAAQSATAGAAGPAAVTAKKTKAGEPTTTTPIKHVVIIFQENVSFDHYFGTYPHAANSDGQPFKAAKGTPAVDGLLPATDPSIPPSLQHSTNLLYSNPNAANPLRLDSSATGLPGNAGGQLTCDQDHNYSDEQQSFDGGAMDRFVQSVGTASGTSPFGTPCNPNTVMDYYDGNSVTALWNYAQHYSMSDNSYGTTFGPSAPGAINLVAGDTGEVDTAHMANNPSISTPTSPDADLTADGKGGYSLTSDAQPYWDDCSTRDAVAMKGTNIGDELNAQGLSLGLVRGRLPSEHELPGSARRDRPHRPVRQHVHRRTSSPRTSRAPNTVRRTRATRRSAAPCTRSASRSAAPASGATRTTTSRTTSRSSSTPRPPTRTT